MAVRLNRHLFTETGTDSGSLNVLGTLVHRFPKAGDYVVSVEKEGRPAGQELIVVGDDYHSVQATVDLASVGEERDCDCGGHCTCEAEDYHCIREGGYGVFHVSTGSGGYSFTVAPIEERGVEVFDSTKLGGENTFATMLMRPGHYALRNRATGAEGRITVVYPNEETREAVREPVRISCTDSGFEPARVNCHPGQGLVFEIDTPSRVVIELREPDDGATEDPSPDRPVRVPRRPRPGGSTVRRTRPRVDPADVSIDELRERLAAITSVAELRSLAVMERRGQNRTTAMEAIRNRLRELARER